MKYLQIKSATSTELGECVLPTMEKPRSADFAFKTNGSAQYHSALAKFKEHIKSLPKLPTTCTLPAGEWFEGISEPDYTKGTGAPEIIVPVKQKDEPKVEAGNKD